MFPQAPITETHTGRGRQLSFLSRLSTVTSTQEIYFVMSILAITSLLNPDPSSAGVERTGESSALPPQASSPSLEPRHRPEDRGQGDGRCSPWRQNTSTSIAGSLPFVPRSSTLPSHQHGPAVAVPETSFRRDPGRIPKSRPKGEVNFLPFEDVSHETRHRILRFHVHALGNIRDSCQHIPYNSGKKDFFEKTGRESLEGTARRPKQSRRC